MKILLALLSIKILTATQVNLSAISEHNHFSSNIIFLETFKIENENLNSFYQTQLTLILI